MLLIVYLMIHAINSILNDMATSSGSPELNHDSPDVANGVEIDENDSAVRSKPDNSEDIPEPPPDMPEDWGAGTFSLGGDGLSGDEDEPVEDNAPEQENGAGVGEEPRGSLLHAIRQGAHLRQVQIPQARDPLKTQSGEFRDVRSELASTLMSKRISQMQKSRNKLTENASEINSLKNAVATAAREGQRFSRLQALVGEVNEMETSLLGEGVTQEVLSSQCDWPVSHICTLRNIVSEIATFKQNTSTCLQQERNIKVNNQMVSSTHLISSLRKLCTSASSISDEDGAFKSMIGYFRIDRDELESMISEARTVAIVLLSELVEKSFVIYAMALEQGMKKIDLIIQVKNSYFTLDQIMRLCRNMEVCLTVPRHSKFSELSLNTSDLQDIYSNLQNEGPGGKAGPTHVRDVELQDSKKPPPVSHKPKRLSFLQDRNKGVTEEMIEAMTAGLSEKVQELLDKSIQPSIYTLCEQTLANETFKSGKAEILDVVMAHRERTLKSERTVLRKDFTWLLEAANQREIQLLSRLINHHKMSIDTGPINKEGNTLFYNATRKCDYEMMIHLLELGANPIVITEGNQTPLHNLAIKNFAPGSVPEVVNKADFGCLNFSAYVDNSSLSDVILVSSEGRKFYSHRLLLCSQSPVFKSMLQSGVWDQNENNEHNFPTIRSQVLSLTLTYMYTGDLVYPHDDLNLGVELLACAQQFLIERMQGEMEHVLSRKIDNGVVIELYQAALSYGANYLFNNCCRHLLMNYTHIADPNHACLLHLFATKKEEQDK